MIVRGIIISQIGKTGETIQKRNKTELVEILFLFVELGLNYL